MASTSMVENIKELYFQNRSVSSFLSNLMTRLTDTSK